ncbi:hypothetical protein ABIC10_008901 [Bradyrhizobium sp. S3.2.12]
MTRRSNRRALWFYADAEIRIQNFNVPGDERHSYEYGNVEHVDAIGNISEPTQNPG